MNCYEAMFNYTIIKDENGEYKTVPKEPNDKGIKNKCIESEILKMYLIPEHSDMQCSKVKEMNDEGIRLLSSQVQDGPTKSRIALLNKFNEIIDKWILKEKPLEQAENLFTELVMNDHPDINEVCLRLV